jgi:ArsR family transcriptional regulator, arsenate/arsenite/antimonite-responsive transcriptional repressor
MAEMTVRELQAVSRAIADPRRFEILQHIAGAACMACSDLRGQFPIAAATLSHHLKELEAAGLIATERRGKFVDATFQRKVWKRYLKEMKRLLGQSECKTE